MDKKGLAILLLWLLIGLYGLSSDSSNANASGGLQPCDELYEIRVALYNGSGAWYDGTLAMEKMFEWMDCIVTTVNGEDIISGCLDGFDVLAWPGGHYPAYWEVGLEGKSKIQEFISDGGGYIGMCAGAWWACDYMVWMADPDYPPPEYKVEGDELNLDLFPGVARGPIEEITPFYTGTMTRINIVDHTHPITSSLPDHMQILYWGGPHLLPYESADVTILGRYDVTGTPAIVAFEYGDGRVFLCGPHPEIEEDSGRDGCPPDPEGTDWARLKTEWSDEGSDWPLLLEAMKWLTHTTFSWNYVFEDTYGRDTTLKINTPHKFFQFITPDKDYGIRKATNMTVGGRLMIIWHKNSELRLLTIAIDTQIDFCFAYAKDMQTGNWYLLIDKRGTE